MDNKKKRWHIFVSGPVFILSWIYTLTFWALFTIFGNLYWLFKMLIKFELINTLVKRKEIKNKIINIKSLILEYASFKYMYDGIIKDETSIFSKWPTWGALSLVSIYREKRGNCEDSSFYFKFLKKALVKNSPEYKNKIKDKLVIYVNYFWNEGMMPHWFIKTIMTDVEGYNNGDVVCFSSGVVVKESPDDVALRILKGNEKYIWLKK
jgi:hypothetical protein